MLNFFLCDLLKNGGAHLIELPHLIPGRKQHLIEIRRSTKELPLRISPVSEKMLYPRVQDST